MWTNGGSLLHKSNRADCVRAPEQASAAGSALGTGQVPVPQGDLHPRAYECGSRLAVQTSCDTWGVETPPEVVSQIWERFYETEVDLFASQETAQCPLYFSLTPPAPLGLDAMAHRWPRRGLYAFPPIALLPGVLAKVRQQGSRLLLIAPRWPTRIWFSDLISLLDGSPWVIPVRRDLLSQAQGTVFHPRPELWNLHVWPLRGPTERCWASAQRSSDYFKR